MTSKHKGVSWSKQALAWQVVVRIGDKLKHYGYYPEQDDAAQRASEAFKARD